jgi:hypothetical protein
MRAFAVAEMVTASLDEPPTNIHIDSNMAGSYTIRICFYREPQHVLAAAAQYGVEAAVVPNYGTEGSTYTGAVVEIDGITVEFWTLLIPTAVAA